MVANRVECKLHKSVTRSACYALVAIAQFSLFALAPSSALAEDFGNDGIDRNAPNFVTASLLIMSPGNELYSCAGHSCIRLECPKFNLDYCFSYESEGVKDKIFTFFMGKLKMGMFAVPTKDWLKMYEEVGRGIVQYRLNLPPDAKQRLWKLLDGKVAEGPALPYDYLERGCAQSDLRVLREALEPYNMVVDSWSGQYRQTRREFVDKFTASHPWNRFFLHAICGSELDRDVPNMQKIVVPSDLLGLLRIAKVNGAPIIDGEGLELLAAKLDKKPSLFSPIVAAVMIVVLAAVNCFAKVNWLDWLLLAFQSLAGLFFTYLVFCSSLTATDWNWLIVPFNLLPLVFWKWRMKWAIWFAGALVVWEVGMIFYPHRLTDPAYLVLVAAFTVMYARIGWQGRVHCFATAANPISRSTVDIFEKLRRDNADAAAKRSRG